ncbi:MAG TPA: XdhC family protein [Microbacterium sp.]|nr:XdhC family protein [Microbacterium sp.]
MLELARDLLPILGAGEAVAVVTVTRVARSAPRGVGASMAVTRDGRVMGSISGGCVESEAVALALAVLATGEASTAGFGFSDEAAHAAGLACGGSVEVVAYRVTPTDAAARAALEAAADDRGVTVTLDCSGDPHIRRVDAGTDPGTPLGRAVTYRESVLLGGALVLSHAARPRLIIVGAGEHAAALSRVGAAAGFTVSVCDVWEVMATRERFPDARDVVVALPHEYLASIDAASLDARTAICVLTHDERLDVPAIATALRLPVGFVGAMGARTTVANRERLLREAGVDDVTLARLHTPLGLDLGGASPDETAVSVLAEIIASRHGGSGLPLREREGPLHARDLTDAPESAVAASCTPTRTAP